MRTWTVRNAAAILGAAVLALFAVTYGAPRAHAQYNDAQYPAPNSQPPYANGPDPNAQAPNGAPAPNGPNDPSQAQTDAGAARISFIHGDVGMQRGDSGETSAATINTPLVAGDSISTGDASRTEVQLDFANVLRLDSNAQINIAALSRSLIQIQLSVGLANFSQYKDSEANAEIDTPNVAVHPSRDGRYRILVTPDGETDVIVRDGEADISTPQGNTKVRKGDVIAVVGTGNDTQYKISKAPPEDDFDNWDKSRDDLILHSGGRDRTNPYYTGTQDLDQYGVWSEVPDYGNVWIPTVQPGWAPYRAGRWVYEPVWGWTWVSYEPWGWAPYHYGRWFLDGDSWAWWPGPVYGGYRPVWAPAYVSFFGFGRGGFSIGFGGGYGFGGGFGSIGWLPIGPGDYFHPWWGGYAGRTAVVPIGAGFRDGFAPLHGGGFSNLRDVAVNGRLRGSVSGLGAGDFGRGGVSARTIGASEFSGGRMMTGNVPVTPTRESMRASDRPAGPSTFSGRGSFYSTRGAGQQGSFSQGSRQSFGGPQSERGVQSAGGFQHFSPQPNGYVPRGNTTRESAQNYGSRSAQPNYRSPSYRPPLDMSKPIVNQRSASSSGYAGSPSNHGSAPTYRPGYSQPTERGSSPSYSRPSYGGGSSGGSPTYRGGGNSPSYHSAPSGGGGSRGGSSRDSGGGGSRGHR